LIRALVDATICPRYPSANHAPMIRARTKRPTPKPTRTESMMSTFGPAFRDGRLGSGAEVPALGPRSESKSSKSPSEATLTLGGRDFFELPDPDGGFVLDFSLARESRSLPEPDFTPEPDPGFSFTFDPLEEEGFFVVVLEPLGLSLLDRSLPDPGAGQQERHVHQRRAPGRHADLAGSGSHSRGTSRATGRLDRRGAAQAGLHRL